MSKPELHSLITKFFSIYPTVIAKAVKARKNGGRPRQALRQLDDLVSAYATDCRLSFGLTLNERDEVEAGVFDTLEDKHGIGVEDFE